MINEEMLFLLFHFLIYLLGFRKFEKLFTLMIEIEKATFKASKGRNCEKRKFSQIN